MTNLITKYRPQVFDDVIGQDAVVRSLELTCKKKDSQAFLFSGPAGCGKTTLARIVAYEYGVDDKQVIEIDGATFTGIDSMRDVQETLRYRPFGNSGKRAIILDECHALSRQALDSLLKVLEEPPAHVVWFFCTTNPAKLSVTIKSRCSKYELKPVADKDLNGLLDWVCGQEKIKLANGVGDLLVKEAKGSPRQLLSNLNVARSAKDKKEAAELIRTVVETDASLELCRFIVNGSGSWPTCISLVDKLDTTNYESVRILVVSYLAACAKSAKTNDQAGVFLEKLSAFSTPCDGPDGLAQFLLSIGRALFEE